MSSSPRKWLTLIVLGVCLVFLPAWSAWRGVRQQQLNRALIAAIVRNDARSVTDLLEQGANANTLDAPPKNIPVWRQILDRWEGRKERDIDHPTALLVALLDRADPQGNTHRPPENAPLVKALLDHGAQVNCKGSYSYDGETIGTTPIWEAILSGKTATCHLLMERGADVRNKRDFSPLWSAVRYGNGETVLVADLIQHGADINYQPDSPNYPNTALSEAVYWGYADVARLLLAHHANMALRDMDGLTPLERASQEETRGHRDAERLDKFNRGRRQIVQMLKAAGAKE